MFNTSFSELKGFISQNRPLPSSNCSINRNATSPGFIIRLQLYATMTKYNYTFLSTNPDPEEYFVP